MPKEKDLKEEEVEKEAEGENNKPVNENETGEREEKAQEYLDGWKRCQADFENYKKRQARFQADLAQYSNQSLIFDILPVIDNFQASLEHVPEEQKDDPWVVGIIHIKKQLEDILTRNGVTEIPVKEGDKFNPAIHEAIHKKVLNIEPEKEPASSAGKKKSDNGKIHKVLQKGYKIGDKVLRAARVIVE